MLGARIGLVYFRDMPVTLSGYPSLTIGSYPTEELHALHRTGRS
jgi:hypothetical protein